MNLITYEKDIKTLQDLSQLKSLIQQNDSDLLLGKIDNETYTLNSVYLKERIDEIEELLK